MTNFFVGSVLSNALYARSHPVVGIPDDNLIYVRFDNHSPAKFIHLEKNHTHIVCKKCEYRQ